MDIKIKFYVAADHDQAFGAKDHVDGLLLETGETSALIFDTDSTYKLEVTVHSGARVAALVNELLEEGFID